MGFDRWGWWRDDKDEDVEERPPREQDSPREPDSDRGRYFDGRRRPPERRRREEEERDRRWREMDRKARKEREKREEARERGKIDGSDDYFDYSREEPYVEEEIEKQLREISYEHWEVLGDLKAMQDELKDAHMRELNYIFSRYDDVLEEREFEQELREERDEIIEERNQVINEMISHLEDSADKENKGFLSRLLWGSGSIGAGLLAAEAYLAGEGIFEFYAESPEIYSDNPEIALVTLGLPALGVYGLNKAYQNRKEYNDLRAEADDYRQERRDLD